MSTQAASVSLEQVLRDCFVALGQSPDHGAKWAELAAPLWITNVTIAQRTLLAQRSSPSETSAWSKFMALLGHESIAVPKDAWPTVEAELIARLAPDRGSSTSFTTPPSNKGKGRDSPPVSPVLVDIQPLPWRLFKKAELQSDGTGYRHFLNAEHGHVFASMGHQHGEQAKDARQREVDDRWAFSNKAIKKAESDVMTKRGNLTAKVDHFFVRPHGSAAYGWEVKDVRNASHVQAAEELQTEVSRAHKLCTRQCTDLQRKREAAEQKRRIKTFLIIKKPNAPPATLTYEMVRTPPPSALVASPTISCPRRTGCTAYCLIPLAHWSLHLLSHTLQKS